MIKTTYSKKIKPNFVYNQLSKYGFIESVAKAGRWIKPMVPDVYSANPLIEKLTVNEVTSYLIIELDHHSKNTEYLATINAMVKDGVFED